MRSDQGEEWLLNSSSRFGKSIEMDIFEEKYIVSHWVVFYIDNTIAKMSYNDKYYVEYFSTFFIVYTFADHKWKIGGLLQHNTKTWL